MQTAQILVQNSVITSSLVTDFIQDESTNQVIMFIAVLLVGIRKETYTLMRKESDIFAFQRIQTFNPVPSAFFPQKNAFFTAKAVFLVLCCQMPLNFATKAFSYNLAKFRASVNCTIFAFTHAHKLNFFLLIHFQFFSCFFCFAFSLLFFSLYLLPFIPFLSTGKVLASVLLKTWKGNIDQLGDLAYFTTNFAPKIGHVLSGIALPEFGRYSKWTHVWMDRSLLC